MLADPENYWGTNANWQQPLKTLREQAQPIIDHVMKFYDPTLDPDGRDRPTVEKMQSLVSSPWWEEYEYYSQKEIMALREKLDKEVDW